MIYAVITLIICIFLVVYPYIVYPLLLKFIPDKKINRQENHKLSATLVFCAYNEARSMPEKLANIEKLKAIYPELEVLAFDDGSSDSTYEQLTARPDLVRVIRGSGRNGKAFGMKQLVAQATGDIIIFTDANVILHEDAINNLMAWYADPSVGGICGSLHYIGSGESTTATVGGSYWRLEEYLKKEESRTGNVMGGDGSIFSLRRILYPNFPDTVLDDLTVSMAAVFNGTRLIKVEDVIAYEGLVIKRGEEFSRKVRISARAFHTHLFLLPQLRKMTAMDKFKYSSRKLIRWFGGLFLIIGGLSAFVVAYSISLKVFISLLIIVVLFLSIGLYSKKGIPATVIEIIIALLATLIGIFRAVRGQTFSVWNPAKSR
jgi:cellulose synthase/poly-beta-1,6-N-acetylglucosamine synthase-like glycosyltransferase